MPRSEKDSELEAILTEINSGIKKDKIKKTVLEEKAEEPDKSEKSAKSPKSGKPSIADKSEKAEKFEKPSEPEKSQKQEKSGEPEKQDKSEKPNVPAKPKKTAKSNKTNKSAKPAKAPEPPKADIPILQESEPEPERKSSFIETAKIIEEAPSDEDIELSKDVKLIEVEEIADEKPKEESVTPPEEPPKKPAEKPTEKTEPISRAELKRRNGTAVSRSASPRAKAAVKPQRGVVILGIFITVFVIIGLISTIWTGVRVTSDIINETSLKQELANVIFPLVIVDIPEFETPEMLDSSAIISSSVWDFIIDESNKSKYKRDDLGSIYVPDVDIEKYVRTLYGSEVKIVHQSVDDSNVQMIYNSESKYYVIESTPKFLPYTPRVDKISKAGDILTLTVSYVLPDAMWNMNPKDKVELVDKVMEYRLKKTAEDYQVLSVKLLGVTNNSQNMTENAEGAAAMQEAEDIEAESEMQ